MLRVRPQGRGHRRFGVQPFLAKIVEERPLQLKTLERQLMLVNDIPGVRVADTALEEIGKISGKFRLVVWIKAWRIFAGFGFDNMGAYAVGPYEAFATMAFNSYFLLGTSWFSASTTPVSVREFGFGASGTIRPSQDGVRWAATRFTAMSPQRHRSRRTHTRLPRRMRQRRHTHRSKSRVDALAHRRVWIQRQLGSAMSSGRRTGTISAW